MAQCSNCGQFNNAESNFCRFCGTKFNVTNPHQPLPQPQQQPPAAGYDYSPPRPYSWQTDEFQTSKPEARKTQQINQVQPLNVQFPGAANQNYQQPQAQPLAFRQPQPLSAAYRCPRCMSNLHPRLERKISSGGWITFAVLLVFFFPLFWIGLLIKEDTHVCPACNTRVG